METFVQEVFSEPRLDPSDPLVVHKHSSCPDNLKNIVIFIHGLGGTRYGRNSTWGFFPRFVFEDFHQADVGLYRYKTMFQRLRFWESINLEDEARILAEIIRDTPQYSKVVLVGHSMGGLLAKASIAFLLHTGQARILSQIGGLILMATPQAGSMRVPSFLAGLSKDLQGDAAR